MVWHPRGHLSTFWLPREPLSICFSSKEDSLSTVSQRGRLVCIHFSMCSCSPRRHLRASVTPKRHSKVYSGAQNGTLCNFYLLRTINSMCFSTNGPRGGQPLSVHTTSWWCNTFNVIAIGVRSIWKRIFICTVLQWLVFSPHGENGFWPESSAVQTFS